mgnify:FL=1
MPKITKIFYFCAAHRYWNPKWDENENYRIFGDDIRLHGHNYELEVTVTGPLNPETGFVVNLMDLNSLVNERIVDKLDHSQIEKDIVWFKGKQPSTENLTIFIWQEISSGLPENVTLYRIRLQETPTIFTEYYGPKGN